MGRGGETEGSRASAEEGQGLDTTLLSSPEAQNSEGPVDQTGSHRVMGGRLQGTVE